MRRLVVALSVVVALASAAVIVVVLRNRHQPAPAVSATLWTSPADWVYPGDTATVDALPAPPYSVITPGRAYDACPDWAGWYADHGFLPHESGVTLLLGPKVATSAEITGVDVVVFRKVDLSNVTLTQVVCRADPAVAPTTVRGIVTLGPTAASSTFRIQPPASSGQTPIPVPPGGYALVRGGSDSLTLAFEPLSDARLEFGLVLHLTVDGRPSTVRIGSASSPLVQYGWSEAGLAATAQSYDELTNAWGAAATVIPDMAQVSNGGGATAGG